MGLFSRPSASEAVALASIEFSARGEVRTKWQGDLSWSLRLPGIYLDWALNKDQKRRATEMLLILDAAFAVADASDPEIDMSFLMAEFKPIDAEVTIAITERLRADVSFRPRTSILSHMYPSFGVVWNGTVKALYNERATEVIESLLDDLREQLSIHAEMGLGMRGGTAPLLAGQRGAGKRLEREIADFAGLSVEEFRSLPGDARDAVFAAHARDSVERAQDLGAL